VASIFLLTLAAACNGAPAPGSQPVSGLRAMEARALMAADVCYRVEDLGPVNFEGPDLQSLGIDARGTVVGTSLRWSPGVRLGFIYEDGNVSQLGTLGGGLSDARAVNARGYAVGGSRNADGAYRATSFYKGTVTDLGTLDGTSSWAVDVNDAGLAVGSAPVSGTSHAAAFYRGRVIDLGTLGGNTYANGVNDRGDIVGSGQDAQGAWSGFLLAGGEMTVLGTIDGAQGGSGAVKINNGGTVCGSASAPAGYHAFLYRNGQMTDLQALGPIFPGWDSLCTDVSDTGVAVGGSYDPYGNAVAFIWRNAQEGLVNLNNQIPGDSSRLWLFWASGINSAGQITAYGISFQTFATEGYLLSPTTCPAP
jgi:probable HAF family extracellular repeat protein